MNDAERGELFRAYVNRPSNHDGESHVTKLLDRCQKAEAEVERLDAVETELIRQREHREDQIAAILRELGSDAEWTSACDLGDHGIEVAAALVGERDRLKAEVERMREWLYIIGEAAPNDGISRPYARQAIGGLTPISRQAAGII